ncbi:MAG: LysE family translocator [Rhizobiaceae bacterium]|nr:LysE family translocator [Rhizobiaceae bacterium]
MEPVTLATYLAYLATVLVFFVHPPGPSQLLFMANSMRHGVRGALPTMAGDLSANSVQILVAGFGLASLVALSAEFFLAVKWAGVLYLVWVGVRTIISSPRSTAAAPKRGALFRQGFVTSAANPYAVIFFAALLPQFIDASQPLTPQIAILGITYLVIDGTILLLMGFTSQRLFVMLGGTAHKWANRISGALMIGAAILLSFKDLTPAEARR